MPRLLHISTICESLRQFVAPIARHFRDLGWEVDGAASGIESNQVCLESFDNCFNVPFSRNIAAWSNLSSGPRRIAQIVADGSYDIIHVHTPIGAFASRFALRNRPRTQKLVYTAHGFHFFDGAPMLQNKVFKRLEMIASPWMDHLVVMNQQDHANALKFNLADAKDITFMHGIGIDLSKYHTQMNIQQIRSSVRSRQNIADNETVFLLIAGFTSNKRHCDAIRALSLLPDQKSFRVVFAGDGETQKSSRALVKKLGLEDRVTFLGYRTDILDLVVASEVVMLISKREGLPRSIMEAMALKKKIIGTRIRGTSDLLRDGIGILIPPCDPQALSKAMVEAIDFLPNQEASAKVLESCSLRNILANHEELYSKLLSS